MPPENVHHVEKTAKKTGAMKLVKMNTTVKEPTAALKVPAAQRNPYAKEGGPTDISTMDHASGLSGMPTPSGQK